MLLGCFPAFPECVPAARSIHQCLVCLPRDTEIQSADTLCNRDCSQEDSDNTTLHK